MTSSKPILCGPCHQREENPKADIWCYNCDEGLCSTCLSYHKRSKGTQDHTTIDIKSYQPLLRAITTECDEHGQQLNLYCPSHLMPCCDECIPTSHSKCTGIKSLAGMVEKSEIDKSKETVETDIHHILNILDKLIYNKSENIKIGEYQFVSMKKSIGEIRKKMNKHLNHLEKKLCHEKDFIWNQEKSKAADFISEIEGKSKNLKEMKEHLQTVTTHSSKLQSFLSVHKIEQQVHQCQRYVENLEKDERVKEVDIKIKQNDEIEKILSKLESLGSLGEVMVVETNVVMNIGTGVRREAQVESREQSNINNMTMNIDTEIAIDTASYISDMICLMDGRVIVVEHLGEVNILTSDGKSQLTISGKAWSVTQINQNTIAITYPYERAIKIFNMENETVTKVITLENECWGLSFSNNSLAVGLFDDEICIIDLDGNTLKSIQVESLTDLENLVYRNDRVIYSDLNGKAVYCYDGLGKQIWQYTQDLSEPEGLCTDTYGNIIVTDCRSQRIIVISKDGQESKVLMSFQENELNSPMCVCFINNESSGVICDTYGKSLAKFNLSRG